MDYLDSNIQKKNKKTGFYIQKIHVIIGFSLNSPDFSPSAKSEKSAISSSYNFDDILDFIHSYTMTNLSIRTVTYYNYNYIYNYIYNI